MKKTALWITGALVVAMGTAGVASAHGKGFGERGDRGPRFGEMFEQIDANGDGKITKEEIDAFRQARFDASDADGDGKLSAEEMMAARDARRMERFKSMVGTLDKDGDGLLSAEELAAGAERRGPQTMLDRFDKDGDGALTLEEIQQARAGFGGEGGMRFGKGHHGEGYGHGRHGEGYGHGHERGEGRGMHGFPFFGRGMSDD